jgi:hypothetical protein
MSVGSQRAVGFLGVLVAALLGFGAVQELVVRGIRGGEVQPLIVGLIAAIVNILLLFAAVAVWRQASGARRTAIVAAVAAIVVHAYAALPPHRNVGMFALAVAVTYAGILLLAGLRSSGGARR